MSKNTSSSAFRKIDVDQFNEDNFKDEDVVTSSGDPGLNESEIGSLLSQSKLFEALVACLANPNIGTKNQLERDAAANLVLRVLLAIKQNQVESIVAKLDNDQKDVLMKYVYRGFENPSEGSSGHLLFWHEKTDTSMALIATVESSGLWIVDHFKWLQQTYEPFGWIPKNYFNIKTPFYMELQALKIAKIMEVGGDDAEEPPRKKRKTSFVHPEVELIKTVLSSNQTLMERCFSRTLNPDDYRRNNAENRDLVANLNAQTRDQSILTRGKNTSDSLKLETISDHKYLIPGRASFYVDDIKNFKHSFDLEDKFDVIVMDPPWENKHIKRINKRTNLDGYNLMSLDQMSSYFEYIVRNHLEPTMGSVIIWSTNSAKQQQQIKHWSQNWNLPTKAKWFWLKVTMSGRPVTNLCSKNDHKLPFELIWILTRSTAQIPDSQTIVSVPSGFHSHKPPLTEILQSLGIISDEKTKLLEIFGRYLQPNWTTFGNEALKFQNSCMFEERS